MSKLKKALLAATVIVSTNVTAAHAQFASPDNQGFSALLGDDTAGAETGVYELSGLIQTAGLAIVTLTVIMVGIVFARKVVRKFTG